jgi:hypothetical protein
MTDSPGNKVDEARGEKEAGSIQQFQKTIAFTTSRCKLIRLKHNFSKDIQECLRKLTSE